MSLGLRTSIDDVETLLDDVVANVSRYDYWEQHDTDYRLEGDESGYGRDLIRRPLDLGYIPASCSGGQLIIWPLHLSVDTGT